GITRLDTRVLCRQTTAEAEVRVGGVALQTGVIIRHDVVHLGAATAATAAGGGIGAFVLLGYLGVLLPYQVLGVFSAGHVRSMFPCYRSITMNVPSATVTLHRCEAVHQFRQAGPRHLPFLLVDAVADLCSVDVS